MLKIRLRRTGRKNEPHYQIVVTPRTNHAKGNFITKLGWLNPTTGKYVIDQKAALKWLGCGAQPSPRVAKLLLDLKIKHPLVSFIPRKAKAPKKKKGETDKAAPRADRAAEANDTILPAKSEVNADAPEASAEEAAEITQEEIKDSNSQPTKDNEEA